MFESFDNLMDRLKATGYFIDPVMTRIVFLAAKLQKPLLLEGPAAALHGVLEGPARELADGAGEPQGAGLLSARTADACPRMRTAVRAAN